MLDGLSFGTMYCGWLNSGFPMESIHFNLWSYLTGSVLLYLYSCSHSLFQLNCRFVENGVRVKFRITKFSVYGSFGFMCSFIFSSSPSLSSLYPRTLPFWGECKAIALHYAAPPALKLNIPYCYFLFWGHTFWSSTVFKSFVEVNGELVWTLTSSLRSVHKGSELLLQFY